MPHNHHHHHHHPGLAFGAGMAIGAGMAMGGTSSSRGGSDTVTVKNNGSTTVVTGLIYFISFFCEKIILPSIPFYFLLLLMNWQYLSI